MFAVVYFRERKQHDIWFVAYIKVPKSADEQIRIYLMTVLGIVRDFHV